MAVLNRCQHAWVYFLESTCCMNTYVTLSHLQNSRRYSLVTHGSVLLPHEKLIVYETFPWLNTRKPALIPVASQKTANWRRFTA